MTKIRSTGFTLMEILIAVSVAVIVGVILINVLVQTNGIFIDQTAQVSQGVKLNESISEIEDLIKQSSAVVNQYPTSGQAQYTVSANTLVLQLVSVNSSGSAIDNVYDYAVITKDPQKTVLKKMVFPDSQSSRKNENTVLSTDLSSIGFTYLDSAGTILASPSQAYKIKFTINLSEKSAYGNKGSNASGQATLGNK